MTRTIVIDTIDHGPVTLGEPFWCTGVHPDGEYRADITHYGEETALVVDTARQGEVRALSASLCQAPFSELETTAVSVAVEFGDADAAHGFNSEELAGFADSLVAFAVGPLHQLIERLQLLEGGES